MPTAAVVFGGPSHEHDVSLSSAKNIVESLQNTPFEALPLGITHDKVWKWIPREDLAKTTLAEPIDLKKLGTSVTLIRQNGQVQAIDNRRQVVVENIDIAFPICHGPFGEDGQLQGFFEIMGLPYVGSRPAACAVSMDKALTKYSIQQTQLKQAPFLVTKDLSLSFEQACQNLKPPLFVKPANMGSSVGIQKVSQAPEWKAALDNAFQCENKVIVEQGLEGQEVECALLEVDGKILYSGVGEIVPHHDFYSYEAKYLDPEGADRHLKARIDEKTEKEIQKAACHAFRQLGCSDYARADFFVTPEGEIYFNEINTHPGFTPISMFPSLWRKAGRETGPLVATLLEQRLNSK